MTSKEFINEFMMDLVVLILSMTAMYVGLAFEAIGLNHQLTLFFFGLIALAISGMRMVFSIIGLIFVVKEDPVYENKA